MPDAMGLFRHRNRLLLSEEKLSKLTTDAGVTNGFLGRYAGLALSSKVPSDEVDEVNVGVPRQSLFVCVGAGDAGVESSAAVGSFTRRLAPFASSRRSTSPVAFSFVISFC